MGSRKHMNQLGKTVLVFDIDGVVAKYQYVKPEDRGPDKAPGIYSAMEPTILQKFITRLSWSRWVNYSIVYLTARHWETLGATTTQWLKDNHIDYPVFHVPTLKDKVEYLDKIIPDLHGVDIKNVLAFDDRWKELMESRVIRRTHYNYPGKSKLVQASDRNLWVPSNQIYYDYPTMVLRILGRYGKFANTVEEVIPYKYKYNNPPATAPTPTTQIYNGVADTIRRLVGY